MVLGVGVGMLLAADLGSDGFSTFVNGVSLSTGVEFWIVNIVVGVVLVPCHTDAAYPCARRWARS